MQTTHMLGSSFVGGKVGKHQFMGCKLPQARAMPAIGRRYGLVVRAEKVRKTFFLFFFFSSERFLCWIFHDIVFQDMK